MMLSRKQGFGEMYAQSKAHGFVLGPCLMIGLCILPINASANSPLITSFFGDWKEEHESCSQKNAATGKLEFGLKGEGNEFISFGDKKCKLEYVGKISLSVSDRDVCLKSGFPSEHIGRYSLIFASQRFVEGHLIFTNANGDIKYLKDCVVHK